MQNNLKSTSLRQLQLKFGQIISAQPKLNSHDLAWVTEQTPLTPLKRVEIYQNAWWLRLSESLEDDYKAVARCLGKPKFRNLIRAYLKECPPHSYTLVHAGNRLPEFIESFQDLATTDPWIADLARFERADYQAYYASDLSQWDPQWLSQLKPETAGTLRLKTQPSVSLLESNWKIKGLLNRGTTCLPGKSYFLIYREGLDSTHKKLKPLQYQLLQLAQHGATLNEWAELAEHSTQWVEWLGEWAKNGVIYPEYDE